MLYEMEAAYKPTVNGELDTQNFEKFPEVSTRFTLSRLSNSVMLNEIKYLQETEINFTFLSGSGST